MSDDAQLQKGLNAKASRQHTIGFFWEISHKYIVFKHLCFISHFYSKQELIM